MYLDFNRVYTHGDEHLEVTSNTYFRCATPHTWGIFSRTRAGNARTGSAMLVSSRIRQKAQSVARFRVAAAFPGNHVLIHEVIRGVVWLSYRANSKPICIDVFVFERLLCIPALGPDICSISFVSWLRRSHSPRHSALEC